MMTENITLDDLLLAHAAGRLPEPVGLVVATHLALAPESQTLFREYEALGGAMLDDVAAAELSEGAFERLLARLDDGVEPLPSRDRAAEPAGAESSLPPPLRSYIKGGIDSLTWKHFGSVSEAKLPLDDSTYRARLIVLKAGKAVPKHTHEGQEITVVLEGAFHDGIGHYGRGEISIADPHVDHRPTADPDGDCLCLTVTDAPLRLTGTFSRFLNPLLRF